MRYFILIYFLYPGKFIYSQNMNDIVKKEAISIEMTEDIPDFSFLDTLIGDKSIVLLGEAGHGDGKTFEIKSEIVKYLVENKDFTIIALEGAGIMDMELYKGKFDVGEIEQYNYKTLTDTWSGIWSMANETKEIRKLIESGKITPVGIDATTTYDNYNFPYILRKIIEGTGGSILEYNVDIIQTVHQKIYSFNPEMMVTEIEFDKLLGEFNLIKTDLKNKLSDEQYSILVQSMQSYGSVIKQHLNNWFTDEGMDKSISIRDKQLFENLYWHRADNNNQKIIVWAANFHVSRNINRVTYKENQKNIYLDFKLMGDHIYEHFPNETYSIGFTSSEGTKGLYFEEPQTIVCQPETMEETLHQLNRSYLYVPFDTILKSYPQTINTVFKTQILGHDDKRGAWLNCFDGIFYIRTQSNATGTDFK